MLRGDGLPENICLNCCQQVNTAYLFRKLCERSDATLRECTAITSLNNEHNNIFKIQIENNKFDLAFEEKSLSQHEQNVSRTENENYKPMFGR